jgi:uncharacterized membrane protein SirB2
MIRLFFAWLVVALMFVNLGLALSVMVVNYTQQEIRYMENFMWFTAMAWLLWGVKND